MNLPLPRRGRSLTVLVLVGAVLGLLFASAGSASAHASLTSSDPADGSVVKSAPQTVTLAFTEDVALADGSVRVLSPDNERVNPKPAQHAAGRDDTAQVALRGKMPKGTYTVAWRVVSSDSHPISGAFTFSVGKASATTAVVPTGSSDDSAVARLYGFLRYLAYSGLALLVGVTVFTFGCWTDAAALGPVRRLAAAGWITLLAATLGLLMLRGPYEAGRGLGAVFDFALLERTLAGKSGLALAARLWLLAAVAALFVVAKARTRAAGDAENPGKRVPAGGAAVRVAGVLLAVGLALTWAGAEHASAGIQVPVAIPAAVLHLLAMAVWLGGLVTLGVILRWAPADALPAGAVARFSRLAFAAVIALTATGVYQSWRQVGSWRAITSTDYGRLLTVKIVLVICVLLAAAFSRRWTTMLAPATAKAPQPLPAASRVPVPAGHGSGTAHALSGGADDGADEGSSSRGVDEAPGAGSGSEAVRRRLRRSVAAEAVLGVVVLAVTTVLTGSQPSRAEQQNATSAVVSRTLPAVVVTVPFDLNIPYGNGKVQITLDAGRVGENTVQALVYGPDDGIATVPEVRLTLTQQARKIGPLDAKLTDQGGYWWTDSLRLPLAGVWTMKVTVRISDVDQVTVSHTVTIRP
ncbi:copper resistance CopC/CopD family protein [Streptomyces sp. NBC_00687]|uniref:copper resistance CopC/CopD family protein n=1 Tax=Streptomyces sp. NBC_00687 TaxID=2975807 RepID=UPI002255DDA4|nr:copper resistance protein CopC [Streptomyces sp. NBC_00687]MCX4920014.1 copper resistance protein CopC [Streptomyces sp. NBC_00687]